MGEVSRMQKQLQTTDLRHLSWAANPKDASSIHGAFLKDSKIINNKRYHYKLSQFFENDSKFGIEAILEVVVYKFLTLLGIDCAEYRQIKGLIVLDGKEYTTYLTESPDYRKRGESKIKLQTLYEQKRHTGETKIDFCKRFGFGEAIDKIILADFLIINRDRHGGNIEVLKDKKENLRVAPIFDNGVCLVSGCHDTATLNAFDYKLDTQIEHYLGSASLFENLKYIEKPVEVNAVDEVDLTQALQNIEGINDEFKRKIVDALYWRLDYALQHGVIRERQK
jgi:hypothetical protein